MRAGLGRCRASAVRALHLGLDRHAQGRAALHRRLPAAGDAVAAMDLRPQARRCLLVHGRRGLDHRPQLCRLRAAGQRCHPGRLRGRAHLAQCRPLLGDDRPPRRDDLLYRAHGDPLAGQGRQHDARSPSPQLPPRHAAHARFGGRADQPRSLAVVLRERRPQPLPDRRHLVADRDRCAHDDAAAGCASDEAGLVHRAAAGRGDRHRRRDRQRCRAGAGRIPCRQETLAVDDPHHLEQPRTLPRRLLSGRLPGPLLSGR